MMMNPHAIPSRMTIAQLLEMIFGKLCATAGSVGDGTIFMNEGDPTDDIGKQLMNHGMEPRGNNILYNGQTGTMINSEVFMGTVFTMRLKHMVEDKWNARGAGRKEQRTRQPTGGRGNEGGLRIGEMERDALLGHGIMDFVQDTYLKRSDGAVITVCDGCGTTPIYNESRKIQICPLCDGPVKFTGNKEIIPSVKRSMVTFSKIQIPYVFQLFNDELKTYMNIGMRYVTGKNANVLRLPEGMPEPDRAEAMLRAGTPLPKYKPPVEEDEEVEEKAPPSLPKSEVKVITASAAPPAEALANAAVNLIESIQRNSPSVSLPLAPQAPQLVTQQQGVFVPMGPQQTGLLAVPEEPEESQIVVDEEFQPLPRTPSQPQPQQQQQVLPSAPNVAPTGQGQFNPTPPPILQQGGAQLMTLQTTIPSVQMYGGFGGAPPTIVVEGGIPQGTPQATQQGGGTRRAPRQAAVNQVIRTSTSTDESGQKAQVSNNVRVTIQKLG
jgi:hypothetical protein